MASSSSYIEFPGVPPFSTVNFPNINGNNDTKKNDFDDNDEEFENCLTHDQEFIDDAYDFIQENDRFLNSDIYVISPSGKYFWDYYDPLFRAIPKEIYHIDLYNPNICWM